MTRPDPLFLVIDQGTQSVRAMLFDPQGALVARSQQAIEPYMPAPPSVAEQDAGYLWQQLCCACEQLWAEAESLKDRVVSVSLTCQRASVVCLDRDMQPLRPAIIWLDQRRTADFPALKWWQAAGVEAVGMGETLRQFRAKAECNWLAATEPELWSRTRHYLLLSGYLTYRLVDQIIDCTASQVGYLPFDYKRRCWAGPLDLKWQALRVKRDQLPPLKEPGETLGTITAHASEQTGIPAGLPLVASGADKACEVLGSGAMSADVGHLSYGTTATFNTCNSKYVEPIRFVPAYPAALPDHFNSEVIVHRGYWMVNWFKREFGQQEMAQAQAQGAAVEPLFDDLLHATPPGAMGLVLQPFWSPGVRVPGPEAKGAVIGFGDVHTRAHLYRAIIEGIGYALREGKERLQQRNGVKISALRVSGGGSQSDAVMQITADIFGLPAVRPHTFETSGLGAAINSAVASGVHGSYPEAVAAMTHQGDVFTPDPDNAALYDALFNQVYRDLYGRLAPLYRRIRDITGYPRQY